MSIEGSPRTEVEDWAEQPLLPDEQQQLLDFVAENILCEMAPDLTDPDSAGMYHGESAEICDDTGRTALTMVLKAETFALREDLPDDEDDRVWVGSLQVIEQLEQLKGYSKPARIFRRTHIKFDPVAKDPITITRSHELKRRSEHKFARPKNDLEREALSWHANFFRTTPQQQDRILIEGLFELLKEYRHELTLADEAREDNTDEQ